MNSIEPRRSGKLYLIHIEARQCVCRQLFGIGHMQEVGGAANGSLAQFSEQGNRINLFAWLREESLGFLAQFLGRLSGTLACLAHHGASSTAANRNPRVLTRRSRKPKTFINPS